MSYVCAECGSPSTSAVTCPRCNGPVFPDNPAGLALARSYRELGPVESQSWDPSILVLGAVGLSYPLWAWLLLTLWPTHENPFALAQWPAVGLGAVAWMIAAWVQRRRTDAAELRLEARLGLARPSLEAVLRSPTFWLVFAAALFFLHSVGSPDDVPRFGFRLGDLRQGRFWTLVTSTFTHVSLGHLGWNCLWLLFLAGPVESRLSRPAFVTVFLLGAVAGKLANAAVFDGEPVMVGMSGAITAVAGAHVVLDPWRKYASTFYPGELPAILALPLIAVLAAFGDVLRGGGGVWAAHLGGLVAGLALGLALRALHRIGAAARQAPLASSM